MKFARILCALALLTATAFGAETNAIRGLVVMKKDVLVPDTGAARFAPLSESQVLPCVACSDDGYTVVCPDAEGNLRVAFLDRRDEWGHATARAWTYDSTVETNTIVVSVPLPLRPGRIPLLRGSTYPLLSSEPAGHVIRYTFARFTRDLPVAADSADLLPPPKPETDPVKIRIAQLEGMLKESREQEADVARRLEQARSNATQVATLLKNVTQSQLDAARLRAELSEAEGMCRELASYKPALQPVPALQQELKALLQEQSKLAAQVQKSQMESEPLKNIYKQILAVQGSILELKTAVSARQAELSAVLKTCSGENFKQDKDVLIGMLDRAEKQHSDVTGQLQNIEAAKGVLSTLTDQATRLLAENQQLRDKLQTATNELQELKKKIQELQQPPKPATAAPADK